MINMNENVEYLQHEINLYKNIPFKERHKEKRRNYQITHSNDNHKNLIDIAKLHGLALAELVEIILSHFLKCRKTFKKNINKLNKK